MSQRPHVAAIQRLTATDNVTNWFYLLRTYVLLAVVIGATVWFIGYRRESQLSFFWNVPVVLAAVALIGALQHHLHVLGHEATHRLLFRNKYLNDLAADWFCFFPLLSCTQHARLQQLAHHQFVNDPELDQEQAQLRASGHWPGFPLAPGRLARLVLGQLWVPRGLRFNRVRGQFQGTGVERGPYLFPNWRPVKIHVRIGMAYFIGFGLFLVALSIVKDWRLLTVVPLVAWVGISAFFAAIPGRWYYRSRLQPVISFRITTLLRFTFITLLFTSLAWLTLLTGRWAVVYYALLWWLPLSTTFTLFMLLRQLAQHGNAGREPMTLSRVFAVNPFWRFFVFPLGQAHHLPHHLFPSVPHYRLRRLHELLMADRRYGENVPVITQVFGRHPGSLAHVLSTPPPEARQEPFVDVSVLDKETLLDEQPAPSGQPGTQRAALSLPRDLETALRPARA